MLLLKDQNLCEWFFFSLSPYILSFSFFLSHCFSFFHSFSLFYIIFCLCVYLSFFFYNSSQLWTKLSRKNTSVRAALNNGNFFQDNFITILVQYFKKLLLNWHPTIIPISMDLHRKSKSQNYYFFLFQNGRKRGRKERADFRDKQKKRVSCLKERRKKKEVWMNKNVTFPFKRNLLGPTSLTIK